MIKYKILSGAIGSTLDPARVLSSWIAQRPNIKVLNTGFSTCVGKSSIVFGSILVEYEEIDDEHRNE